MRSTTFGHVFADIHYDFYYVPGTETPIIPIRIGYMLR